MNNELMDKTCAWTCASIANQVYASQGTDPDLCPQIERENAQITGGDQTKMAYKLIETASFSSINHQHHHLRQHQEERQQERRLHSSTSTATATTAAAVLHARAHCAHAHAHTSTTPNFAPPAAYMTAQ